MVVVKYNFYVKNMLNKRNVFAFVLGLVSTCYTIPCFGESTIYLFLPSVVHIVNGRIDINGTDSFDFQGDLKKEDYLWGKLTYPIKTFHACKKKIILKSEGKVILSYSADKYDFKTGNVIKDFWKAEIQVNCSEGSEHYVKVDFKGFSDCQLKLMDSKEFNKRMNDKKYILLDEYYEQ